MLKYLTFISKLLYLYFVKQTITLKTKSHEKFRKQITGT